MDTHPYLHVKNAIFTLTLLSRVAFPMCVCFLIRPCEPARGMKRQRSVTFQSPHRPYYAEHAHISQARMHNAHTRAHQSVCHTTHIRTLAHSFRIWNHSAISGGLWVFVWCVWEMGNGNGCLYVYRVCMVMSAFVCLESRHHFLRFIRLAMPLHPLWEITKNTDTWQQTRNCLQASRPALGRPVGIQWWM